jgi:hypothetical protein
MPTEVENLRDLARAYWAGSDVRCPRHGAPMQGTFVRTTYADHIALVCSKGRETVVVPQRPKQMEFLVQQVEGLVENIQRGDAILCYRCQSPLEVEASANATVFTCIRCFSWGTWSGKV